MASGPQAGLDVIDQVAADPVLAAITSCPASGAISWRSSGEPMRLGASSNARPA